jgi:hypothetical protein
VQMVAESAFRWQNPSRSSSVPSDREAFGYSIPKAKSKRRWSGISGNYNVELRLIVVLSLQATPRV